MLFSNPLSRRLLALAAMTFNSLCFADSTVQRPDSHAPIAVMGDHTHKQGEFMFSYRFMTMDMEGNVQGKDNINPEDIVTNLANPNPGPANVRVVPLSMQTQMHMFGMMYAPNDSITLMAMLHYIDKEMDHVTFMGMMGTDRLGNFTTETSGIGDTKIAALWQLFDEDGHKIHLNIGVSLPTGSIDEEGQVLTPMNTRPTLRLPYAMQLGSGTYDFQPGITYTGTLDAVSWGSQYRATLRTGENDENYTLGDVHQLGGWFSLLFSHWASGSVHLSYRDQADIDGRDLRIAAPVQTANPDNYGGQRVDLGFGINTVTKSGHRFAFEYQIPIEQDVNGVQMDMQSMLTLGYQYAF